MGTEENIIGYCSRCSLLRPFARKLPSNIHYNCSKKNCCLMLHQWDVCDYCLTDKHGDQPSYDDKSRRDEVATFHNVFSKLPDDIKINICEYVPIVFQYVENVTRLIFIDRKLASLDQYVSTRTKSTWCSIRSVIAKKYSSVKVNKGSTRKQICAGVQHLYKKMYLDYTKSLIKESDFWTHKSKFSLPRYSVGGVIQDLEIVKSIL